jgi:hypothetical protein
MSDQERIAELESAKNGAYAERNKLVAFLAALFPSSMERHEGADWEDDWRWVVMIDLPAGQVSWHIHDSELPLFAHIKSQGARRWDGHTNEQKWERVASSAQQPLHDAQRLDDLEAACRQALAEIEALTESTCGCNGTPPDCTMCALRKALKP